MRPDVQADEIIPYHPESHLETVRGWWSGYYPGEDFPGICLPDSGCIALYHGKPAAIAFLYKCNAKMTQIQFPVVDPALGAGRRINLLKAAIAGAMEMAKEHLGGEGFIWCCTDHAVVGRIYAENKMICAGEADVYFLPLGSQPHEFLK